jgi:hypothetical protein
VAELTIQGLSIEKSMKAQADAPKIRIGQDVGRVFRKGNTWKNSTIANMLRLAITNARRAQKRAGSLPASLLTWVILHPAIEKAKRANDRLTQWLLFLEYTRAPRAKLRRLTRMRNPSCGTASDSDAAEG